MPVHDWSRVPAGIFHHFHHCWIDENARALNRALRGTEFYALAEQLAGGWGPDVVTLERPLDPTPSRHGKAAESKQSRSGGAVALAVSPPQLRYRFAEEKKWYAARQKAVTIRHISEHSVVAVLEILSPGNKSSRAALDDFVHKVHDLLRAGIHFALVDLFPPTRRDPQGIHPRLWDDDDEAAIPFDAAKPLTCASYRAGPLPEAFVEPVSVGDMLPPLPVFLGGDEYVPVPLEETYGAALAEVPDVWRDVLTAS